LFQLYVPSWGEGNCCCISRAWLKVEPCLPWKTFASATAKMLASLSKKMYYLGILCAFVQGGPCLEEQMVSNKLALCVSDDLLGMCVIVHACAQLPHSRTYLKYKCAHRMVAIGLASKATTTQGRFLMWERQGSGTSCSSGTHRWEMSIVVDGKEL